MKNRPPKDTTAEVVDFPTHATRERAFRIEDLICDLDSMNMLLHLSADDGDRRLQARDWLVGQQKVCIDALKELVMPDTR